MFARFFVRIFAMMKQAMVYGKEKKRHSAFPVGRW